MTGIMLACFNSTFPPEDIQLSLQLESGEDSMKITGFTLFLVAKIREVGWAQVDLSLFC